MTTSAPTLFALLVGIDQYASSSIPALHGCVNDVDAMEQMLRDRFGVQQANILKLTNQEATHQRIKDAFRTHLIGSGSAWSAATQDQPSPAFLFHFSGHGSRAFDPTGAEPDQCDETIVPYDSRLANIYDIKDWELGQLLNELTTLSHNVTVILDCCHSGSGTRDMKDNILAVRSCPPDLRPQPRHRSPIATAQTRGALSTSGWMQAENYVLLAACHDAELANEMVVKEGEGNRHHGVLSYFLIQELARMRLDQALTYRELHQQLCQPIVSRFADQTPQCEGDRDRLIFAGLRPKHDPLLTVVAKEDGMIWVDGGCAHGLSEESELHVYPPGTRSIETAGAPLATLLVARVGAVRSGCTVVEEPVEIPLLARVAIHRIQVASMRRQLVLDVPNDSRRAILYTRLTQEPVSNYLEVVGDNTPAEFRLELLNGQLQLQNGTSQSLVAAYPLRELEALVHDLMHLVRYYNALELHNPLSTSALNGKVTLALKERAIDPPTGQPLARELPVTAGNELVIGVDQPIVLEITNHAHCPVYLGLFEFGYEWDIVQWYPPAAGAHEALLPGATLSIGLQPEEIIAFQLPAEKQRVRETLKLIATTAEADFEILTMGPLKSAFIARSVMRRSIADSALNQLFELAMENQPSTRAALKAHRSLLQDEWTTAEVGFVVVR